MVLLTLRVMQGLLLPLLACPEALGAKDTGFEIDMADNANGIIIGKLVKALPTFRAVA